MRSDCSADFWRGSAVMSVTGTFEGGPEPNPRVRMEFTGEIASEPFVKSWPLLLYATRVTIRIVTKIARPLARTRFEDADEASLEDTIICSILLRLVSIRQFKWIGSDYYDVTF